MQRVCFYACPPFAPLSPGLTKRKKERVLISDNLDSCLVSVFFFFTKYVASTSSRNATIFSVELHFGKNKDMRKIGQIDIKKAKSIYLEEVAASGLLTKEELNRL